MKVVVRKVGARRLYARDMNIGQIGEVVGHAQVLLLRTCLGWVNLKDPTEAWSNDFMNLAVELLPSGSIVEILVENKDV